MNSPAWLAIVRAAWKRKRGIPGDRKAREAKVAEVRREAWAPITDESRAEDRQRLAKRGI